MPSSSLFFLVVHLNPRCVFLAVQFFGPAVWNGAISTPGEELFAK
jgi:hypothetical protein